MWARQGVHFVVPQSFGLVTVGNSSCLWLVHWKTRISMDLWECEPIFFVCVSKSLPWEPRMCTYMYQPETKIRYTDTWHINRKTLLGGISNLMKQWHLWSTLNRDISIQQTIRFTQPLVYNTKTKPSVQLSRQSPRQFKDMVTELLTSPLHFMHCFQQSFQDNRKQHFEGYLFLQSQQALCWRRNSSPEVEQC